MRQVKVGTFHKLTIDHLKKHGRLTNIVTPHQQRVYLNRALEGYGKEDREKLESLFEEVKCTLGEHPQRQSGWFRKYEQCLERVKLPDLYDVMRTCVLEMSAGTLPTLGFTHLLCDEQQDTDQVQAAWIMNHVNAGTVATLVGDDDQCIYEWRRALGFQGMFDFAQQTGAKIITLGDNFRSRTEILDHAERLIQHNVNNRLPKVLTARRGGGGIVRALRFDSQEHMFHNGIMPALKDYLDESPTPNWREQFVVNGGTWAVIARTNREVDYVECLCNELGVRAIRTGKGIWDQHGIGLLLELLHSVQSGSIIGVDMALAHAGVPHDDLTVLHARLQGSMGKLLDGQFREFDGITKLGVEYITSLTRRSVHWRRHAGNGAYDLVISAVGEWVKEGFGTAAKDADGGELGVHRYINTAVRILTRLTGSLSQRVNLVRRKEVSDECGKNALQLYTMHAVKGLEFDHVVIFNASNEVGSMSNEASERRLFYVAMTRAKDHLLVLGSMSNPSRYLMEAGLVAQVGEQATR
jgi:superfamily I DNA/RNA helicase